MGFKALKSRLLEYQRPFLTRPTRGSITAEYGVEKSTNESRWLNIAVQWSAFELRIPEVSGSYLGTETVYPYWRLHGFPQSLQIDAEMVHQITRLHGIRFQKTA